MSKQRLTENDVLTYSLIKRPNKTVKRYYLNRRKRENIPERCDSEKCIFHNKTLIWNGRILELILDHIDGNNRNNTTKNLQLLCPNCNSQQPTQGGKNKNRIQNQNQIGYEINYRDGRRDAVVLPKPL